MSAQHRRILDTALACAATWLMFFAVSAGTMVLSAGVYLLGRHR